MKTKYSQNPGIGLIMGSFSATCFFTHAFIIHSFLGFSAFSSVVSAPSFFSSPSAGLTSFDSLSSSGKHKLVLRVRCAAESCKNLSRFQGFSAWNSILKN